MKRDVSYLIAAVAGIGSAILAHFAAVLVRHVFHSFWYFVGHVIGVLVVYALEHR